MKSIGSLFLVEWLRLRLVTSLRLEVPITDDLVRTTADPDDVIPCHKLLPTSKHGYLTLYLLSSLFV